MKYHMVLMPGDSLYVPPNWVMMRMTESSNYSMAMRYLFEVSNQTDFKPNPTPPLRYALPPTLKRFHSHCVRQVPAKIEGMLRDWPALHKWKDPSYFNFYFVKMGKDSKVSKTLGVALQDENVVVPDSLHCWESLRGDIEPHPSVLHHVQVSDIKMQVDKSSNVRNKPTKFCHHTLVCQVVGVCHYLMFFQIL